MLDTHPNFILVWNNVAYRNTKSSLISNSNKIIFEQIFLVTSELYTSHV